ncbi:MAG: macro domain-containing protein [Candidatus Limnocylindrales bacterium]|jgi:O-acetyl-ADP-ribose deacetylase (regulator of RNase III)
MDVLHAERAVGHSILALTVGDLSEFEADALVNAANSALAGGGGVDGAIHRRGGPSIMAETLARYPEGCPTGSAVATGAGELRARWIIHAVGPVWRGGWSGERDQLGAAYGHALRLADEVGAHTVGLPALSTGVYGYPMAEAAQVALACVRDHLQRPTGIERATFVLFTPATFAAFARALEALPA